MRAWLPLALAVGLAALVTPPATATGAIPAEPALVNPGPAPTTLFLHLIGHGDVAMNLQAPPDGFTASPTLGYATHSTTCLPSAPGVGFTGREYHTWHAHVSPELIDYDAMENGRPAIAAARGLMRDATVSTEWTLRWYLQTSPVPDRASEAPIVVPDVVVQAELLASDFVHPELAPYEGPVLGQGTTGPTTLSPNAPNHSTGPDGEHIYAFDVPIRLANATLSARDGLTLRIRAFVDVPACTEGRVTPNTLFARSDNAHRPRVDFETVDPLQVELAATAFPAGMLAFHLQASSPWGLYDVVRGDVLLSGPSAAAPEFDGPVGFAEHHHPYPRQRTYTTAWNQSALASGLYTVQVRLSNHVGNANASALLTAHLGEGVTTSCTAASAPMCLQARDEAGVRDASAPAAAFAAIVMLGAAVLQRRDHR